jgi:hypothetical protein
MSLQDLRVRHALGTACPEPGGKHGVNLNNFDPRLQESVQVRRFDGADTWKFID